MIEDTLKLIQLIEQPKIERKSDLIEEKELMRLFQISFDNGISHYFLTQIITFLYDLDYADLIKIYEQYKNRESHYIEAFKRIIDLMYLYDVSYVIFKTLKPYPFMGSSYDIDLLILTISNTKFKNILNNLKDQNYVIKSMGINHIALHDMDYDINIDLYIAPSYADMIYIDKTELSPPHKIDVYGMNVNVLPIEEELLIMILDSAYSDRRYKLKDYYNILLLINKMNHQQKYTFKELTQQHNMKYAISLVLHLTNHLYYISHNKFSNDISKMIKMNPLYYPMIKFEIKRLMKNGTPMRYHLMTFLISHVIKHGPFKAFLELFTWPFVRAFYYEIKLHIKRK